MEHALWHTICANIEAKTDPAVPYAFEIGDWRMRIGPRRLMEIDAFNGTSPVGFELADCAWPEPAPSRERVKQQLAKKVFAKTSAFPTLHRPFGLDAFSFWFPLQREVCKSAEAFEDAYNKAVLFLAHLGGMDRCAFGEQIDRSLKEFSPQCSTGEESCKGLLTSNHAYEASFSTLRHLKHRHDVHAKFALPPGSPHFEFESSRFPLKHFDWIKVGNKLCDKAFFFKTGSDRYMLKCLVPPLNSLATLEGRFRVCCDGDALKLDVEYCDTLSVIPAIAALAEIWRCILEHNAGLEFVAQPTPIFCPVNFAI